ncbi:hypothetical protein [Vreelandella venusta]|uniref:hypothetical protein n=1 Tax=Vreelandella venusta TaxID=44935 RepID=UPI00116CFC04|nr:hypothetical protein [Halomonas venusta]GEK52389.1 hypothetical protein HVE01_31100 [Halomonas venusta]
MTVLTIPSSLVDQVICIPELRFPQISPLLPKQGTPLTQLIYLSYAARATHLLLDKAIPFDLYYKEGEPSHHFRYEKDGTLWRTKLLKEEVNIPLSYLLPLADKTDELTAFINNHKKAIELPSWENQEEYRKIHLTKRLINPHQGN